MFCPLKLYFQKNLDEEIKENVQKVQESLREQLSWDSIISRIEAMVEEKK